MPENAPPKLTVGLVLCCPCWATPALLGTQGQVFLKAKRSKHRSRLGFETSSGNELRGKYGLAPAELKAVKSAVSRTLMVNIRRHPLR
jgi:hypothetical protein